MFCLPLVRQILRSFVILQREEFNLDLTAKNFDSIINNHDTVLVDFYALWGGLNLYASVHGQRRGVSCVNSHKF